MLEVRGLSRWFGELRVLSTVDLHVAAGTATAVVGPNGSGKTTLLRCVAGLDRPDEGEVRLDGRPVDETDPRVRAAVAGVLDDVDFFPDLSVVEHLELLAFAHGAPDPATVAEVLDALGLTPARDQLPATLSSGQRRRLALASCFVRPRRLLLLDEPEQRLDTAGRTWLAERLNAEKAAGRAVLLASHDPLLVDTVADHTLTL
ncbi:heme ABC exporter ATP-binding protein CcmA [Virgisporangium aurantiacum]|uniref:ABC transporter ATP-binding protein n=1 Tax=Virgisporangium aurantiacum TaxID=175570 RepID=A0A8J3ZEJ4_9ACTN|nr:heme ABC exporter ATP-binding protein CcmA [Virgisporangium aurantiacum]GIJ60200.1 ABC transporter ATP-binding protein [Virgisporangium aurantiacum]